jgi:hypothetical protein
MGEVINSSAFDEARARFLRHRERIRRILDAPPARLVRGGDDLTMGHADPEIEELSPYGPHTPINVTGSYVAPPDDCA